MKSSWRSIWVRLLVLAVPTWVLSGCSNTGEDVRVTLCKDMVLVRLGEPSVTWNQSETKTRGYEHAEVRLSFTSGARQGDATCYYKYDAVEHTALTLADPLAAYSTSPSRMVLNGKELSRSVLAQTVKDAMLKQGRELVDGVRKGLQ